MNSSLPGGTGTFINRALGFIFGTSRTNRPQQLGSGGDGFKLLPLFLLILLVGIAPFFSALYNSFFHDYFGRRSFAGIENYLLLLSDTGFLYSIRISLVWALLNSMLSVFLGLLFASLLFEAKRGFRWFYFALLVPWGIPIYISVPLWRMIVHGNGGTSLISHLLGFEINLLQDPVLSFVTVLLVSIWMNLPITAFVFYASLRKISTNVIDAARLDGAGRFGRFRWIYTPLSGNAAAIMLVFNFIGSFKEFTLPFMMTAGGPPLVSGITEQHIIGATTTVEILLYDIFMQARDFGVPAAYAVVTAGLVVLIMIIWFFVKTNERRRLRIALFLAVVELALGGTAGIALALLFILGGRYPKLFTAAAILDLSYWIYSLLTLGFLAGFHIPSLAVVGSLFILRRGGRLKLRRLNGLPLEEDKARQGEYSLERSAVKTGGVWAERMWRVFTLTIAGVTLLSALLIIYMVLWMSFSDLQAAYIDRPLPTFFSFDHFIEIFTEEGILRYFGNTFIVAAFTGLLTPLFTFPAAHAVARMRPAAAGRLFSFIQMLGLLGGIHALIPLFIIFRHLGLINTFVPVVLIYLMHAVPFSLFTISSYLEHMPKEFEEISRLEGASPLRYLISVLLPLSVPIIVTSVMVAFIGAWNGFLVPLIFLQDDSLFTIGVKLHEFVGSIASGTPRWGAFAAASVINMLFIGLIFYRFKDPLRQNRLAEQ